MTKFLHDLSEMSADDFEIDIARLERASGHSAFDARLVGDIIQKSYDAITDLGLDNKDTTSLELYRGLVVRTKKLDANLLARIGGLPEICQEDLLKLIRQALIDTNQLGECLAVKKSVLRDFIRQLSPKMTMQRFEHKSIEALIKHEDIMNILAVASFTESANWHQQFNDLFKKISNRDFENRQVEIIVLSPRTFTNNFDSQSKNHGRNLNCLEAAGAVAILPNTTNISSGATLWITILILEHLVQLQTTSFYFRIQQTRPNFGELVARVLNHGLPEAANIAGNSVTWQLAYRVLCGLPAAQKQIYEPKLMPEHYNYLSLEAHLAKLDPDFSFWKELGYVGRAHDGKSVSFNIIDCSVTAYGNLDFVERSTDFMKASLAEELLFRYVGQGSLRRQLLEEI